MGDAPLLRTYLHADEEERGSVIKVWAMTTTRKLERRGKIKGSESMHLKPAKRSSHLFLAVEKKSGRGGEKLTNFFGSVGRFVVVDGCVVRERKKEEE